MWLWILGAALTAGGIALARMGFSDEAFLGPVLGWGFVGIAMLGACVLVYKASTAGLMG